ncbi:MAG TPA: sodium-dependent transporter [Chlamydiales bacterium]|nr:sodium-dependent transporter [Chlamydiales bacterium]
MAQSGSIAQPREHWGTKIGFLMATAGSAIGLGSLWRFPYVIGQNGGGAFVLLYFLFTFLIGIPVFIAELVMGRNTQKCVVNAFSDLSQGSSHWRIAGWLNVITNFLILSYYSVVAGWALNYTFMSLSQFTAGKTPEQIKGVFDLVFTSADINIFWHFLFMLLTIGVVYGGVKKGIEFWSRILTPALLAILVGLFFFATTLPGFKQAFQFTLYPDFSKLTSGGILEALGMSFWTLSIGLGIVLTYGSYMKSSEDIPKTGFIIAIVSACVSLFAALMIFPIVFTFGFAPEAGPGLVFKTLPVLFSQLPATMLISTVFFVLFVFAALTSSISILEVLVASLMELFQWSRKKAVLISGGVTFLFGIPSAVAGAGSIFPNWQTIYGGKNFFDTLNYITGSWMMPVSGLLFAVFVGWFMDRRLASEEYLKGTKMVRLLRVWLFLIRWLAPVGIFIIILQESGLIDLKELLQ